MNKLILAVVIALGLTANAFSASNGLPQPSKVRDLLNYGGQTGARAAQLGTQLIDKKIQVLKAQYSFAVAGGAISTINLKDVDGKDAVIPNKAVIRQVIFDCVTTATSGGAATIAFGANSTTDLKAATAVASWTGLVAGVPVGTAATAVKTTAERTITATIATAALTAGKINAFIEYYISD